MLTLATLPPDPALLPELRGVVDAGVLARAAAHDGGERRAPALPPSPLLTPAQAVALAALLGLGEPPANDREP